MPENENLLGLGSLWDAENLNIHWDEQREQDREHRAEKYFRDALAGVTGSGRSVVRVRGIDLVIHPRRIGMMWLDGVACGTSDRVIVPFGGILVIESSTRCSCDDAAPDHFELVSFGAVLRELERRATVVTVMGGRYGQRGRIIGVWRDALTLRGARGTAVFPLGAVGSIVVEEDGGT